MLNQYEVTLSKYAFDQLDEIRQYYEFDLFLPHVAHKLLSEIENAFVEDFTFQNARCCSGTMAQ